MLSTIRIHDLKISCIIGVYPRERVTLQPLFLDIDMEIDIRQAAKTENVRDTVDYAGVAQMLTNLVQDKKFKLIESVAVQSCDLIMSIYTNVIFCRVQVRKPEAMPQAKWVSVVVEQHRLKSESDTETG